MKYGLKGVLKFSHWLSKHTELLLGLITTETFEIGELVKNQNRDGKVKSLRRREFREYRYRGTRRVRTCVRRNEHEMKRNTEIGFFTKSSKLFF